MKERLGMAAGGSEGRESSPRPPKVSAVIIVFNGAEFLEEAIESAIAQTSVEWELLVVDDGSTDDSPEIARRYARRDPGRVRYLEHPGHVNRGMSATRNLGLRESRGQYVAFLDADDCWLPNTLADQAALLDMHPRAALVAGPMEWWHSWSGHLADLQRDVLTRPVREDTCAVDPPEILARYLADEIPVPNGIMVRRAMALAVGGYEESFGGLYEDQVFCVKICHRYPVVAATKTWYRYRQHAASSCSVGLRTGAEFTARRRFLEWTAAYLSASGDGATEVPQEATDALRNRVEREIRRYRWGGLYRRYFWMRLALQDFDPRRWLTRWVRTAVGALLGPRARFAFWARRPGFDVAMETLAIIARLGPLTQAEVYAARGTVSPHGFRILLSLDLIEAAGHAESRGRPRLYRVSAGFRERFLPRTDASLDAVDRPAFTAGLRLAEAWCAGRARPADDPVIQPSADSLAVSN